jgi:hypothetical protein
VTLRVYVACASAEWQRAESVAARLEAAGCELTYAWWLSHPVRQGKTDADQTPWQRRDASMACENAIKSSDVVVVLGSKHASTGLGSEVTTARGAQCQVVIVGNDASAFVEPRDGERYHTTDDAAIAYLADRLAGRWR